MKSMGSKRIISKQILPIILKNRKPEQWYIEPFVGGANMIDKVDGKRLGVDINKYVIAVFNALQDGWIPPKNISEIQYRDIRSNKDLYKDEIVGFVGICCSFGGKWFGGYARDSTGRNYCEEGHNNLMKQYENIKGIKFVCSEYDKFGIPEDSLIYCDPPYEGATRYRGKKFNHTKFWDWCREKSLDGHDLFVSELNAPKDFECLIEIEKTVNLDSNRKITQKEKVFKFKQ